ncbi:hypothetical protein Poli38472_008537 [Pythium oligandrum]|uniref:BZIP domain-containing protein n=1 Tax=Pythium oligandrum TaxID=41045 RepID=A0A8K1FCJ4_PYTOL|nr:hypothetical protein Poli38472_008537 [Pythium oligandrum]|eukprot:TMW55889.1 hypothetical protein Poli38472_008537 [Pythium oligandrum]
MNMELTPEDDDLLSYFLSADVAAEQLTQPKPEPAAAYTGLGGAAGNASEFAFAQPMAMTQDGRAFGGAPSQGISGSGGVTTVAAMQGAFHAGDAAMMRGPQDDDANSTTASASGLDSDEKRQRRLARNRESARQSRRRKKQYLELLEEKVSQLTESIDATRASHLDRADDALNAVRSEILATLAKELSDDAGEGAATEKIRQGIQLIRERFGPNSLERNAVKDYNFRQLDNLLLPPYCRFLLWLSIQDDSFFDEANGLSAKAGVPEIPEKKKTPTVVKKDNLWQTLISELALTYEQDEKLKSLYKSGDSKASKLERRRVALAVAYLSKLKHSLEERAKEVQTQTDTIHSILTPEQSLTYLRWVDMNQDHLASFVDKSTTISSSGAVSSIQTILKKPDRELTVEDVTALLGEL